MKQYKYKNENGYMIHAYPILYKIYPIIKNSSMLQNFSLSCIP